MSLFAHNTPGMRECVCVSPKFTPNLPTDHPQVSVPSHESHTAKWPPCTFFWEEVKPAKHTRLSRFLGHRCPAFLLPLPKQELITSCSSWDTPCIHSLLLRTLTDISSIRARLPPSAGAAHTLAKGGWFQGPRERVQDGSQARELGSQPGSTLTSCGDLGSVTEPL